MKAALEIHAAGHIKESQRFGDTVDQPPVYSAANVDETRSIRISSDRAHHSKVLSMTPHLGGPIAPVSLEKRLTQQGIYQCAPSGRQRS